MSNSKKYSKLRKTKAPKNAILADKSQQASNKVDSLVDIMRPYAQQANIESMVIYNEELQTWEIAGTTVIKITGPRQGLINFLNSCYDGD
jgi:hypothetical protein